MTPQILPALLTLMMVPAFARSMPPPSPPIAGTEPIESNSAKEEVNDQDHKYPSNVGAVNEGGGSANTSGMSNGLTPNSSGSGTNSSNAERASDTGGIPLGGSEPKGTVEQKPSE